MNELYIREVRQEEMEKAAQLLGRGMRDNHNHIQAFGPDSEHRERALARMFMPVLHQLYRKGSVLGAFRDDTLVGVCAMAPPGKCQASISDKVQVLPIILKGNGFATVLKILEWLGEWSKRDLPEAHWHLGPIAVDAPLQGQGIGSALMAAFCARVDEQNGLAYLETDKPDNIKFYEKFGFAVVGEATVIGTSNWFMRRAAQANKAG
jgi:ribosomal protein S18 acetylase RimI-like enzyme